jgi:flavin-dependent dehydrogenase
MAVHRVLALLLIPALIATSGVVSSLHTHAYDDHDHPEHHHGLAIHEHHALPAHSDDGLPHVEGCDPGKHAVPFAFVCAAPPQVHAVDAVISLPGSPTPELQIERAIRHTDVRVHGPPSPAHTSPRAPPAIPHA